MQLVVIILHLYTFCIVVCFDILLIIESTNVLIYLEHR